MIKWSKEPEMVKFLIGYIPGHQESEIRSAFLERFGITLTEAQIGNFKHKYGVKSGTHGGRFEKGQPALNKGKKMSQEQYKKCSGTMFRKGHSPQNHREVGSERINVDGYIEIKVEEPNKWRLKQRVMYEKYHNVKLTRNEAIVFLDGNKLNLAEDNLFCLTRAELVRYNQNKLRGEDSETGLGAALLAKLSTRLRRSIKGE
jgi:hypothetical protein